MTGTLAVSERFHRPIRKANPGVFQSDQEVIDQFVVRNHEFGIVLEVLRGNTESSSCQHILVVGPRGRGKTMLLARVAAEIRTDDGLSGRLLPVRFMEESQEISGIADFWLETLFHLARQSKGVDADLARELRETHIALSGRWREKSLSDHARAAVLSAADRLDRKLVLMVENLQMLCESVDRDFGWQLRAVLQSEPQIMLLASATGRFEGLDDAEQPFFELFRIVGLSPLANEDCRRLWQTVSGDSMTGRKIRPLEILTGGNPRLLVIVAGFARHRSLRQLMEELVVLIDEHTEYFRGHLEALPRSERRVYIAVLDLWQPSTTGEIADRARMDVRVVSTMLGRLVQRGAVISDPAGGSRKRLYSAAERLYSIYYKLRRERDEAVIVRNLIHFMVGFYSEGELSDIYGQMFVEAAESPAIREGIERAMVEIPEFVRTLFGAVWRGIEQVTDQSDAAQRKTTRSFAAEVDAAFQEKDFQRVIEIVDEVADAPNQDSSGVPESLVAWGLIRKSSAFESLGDVRAAIETYDEIIKRFDSSKSRQCQAHVVTSVVCKRVLQESVTESQAELMIHDELVARLGADSVPRDLLVRVAHALFNEAATQNQRGDSEGAIEDYDEVIRRFGTSEVQELEVKVLVARALVDKGITRGQLGEPRAAIENYDEVLQRFDSDSAPELQVEVARALFNTGVAHGQLGKPEAAIAAYGMVVERFGSCDSPELQQSVAMALFAKGVTQVELGQAGEGLRACEKLEQRLGAMTGAAKTVFEWRALCLRAMAQIAQKQTESAIDTFRAAYAAFQPSNETIMRGMLGFVQDLISSGAPERDIIEILSSDNQKSDVLAPLIVALRQRIGETVRAPEEVIEVAQDVRERIEKQ